MKLASAISLSWLTVFSAGYQEGEELGPLVPKPRALLCVIPIRPFLLQLSTTTFGRINKAFNKVFFPSSADAFCQEHGVTFLTTITDKFEVAFGAEGETVSLGCTVIVYPTVKNYQPEVVWYRDCK